MRVRVHRKCWCGESATAFTPPSDASNAHHACTVHATEAAARIPTYVDIDLGDVKPGTGSLIYVTYSRGVEWRTDRVHVPTTNAYADVASAMAEGASNAVGVAEVLLIVSRYPRRVHVYVGGEYCRVATAEELDRAVEA